MSSKPSRKNEKKIDKLERKVNGITRTMNAELKYRDEPLGTASIASTGSFVLLNNLAQGDSATTRTGNSVVARTLEMRFNIRWNAAAASTSQGLRVMLLWDRQANGSLPALNTVLQATDYLSPVNDSFRKRYKVIYDKNFVVASVGPLIVQAKKLKKLGNTVTRYNGNAGTVADVVSNSLLFYLISSDAANGPTIQYQFRLRYTDF